jgi:hypothetical protein
MEYTSNFPKFLNPEYLFAHLSGLAKFLFHLIFNGGTWTLLHVILYILAIFFLSLTFYSIIRLFETRHREHAHMHHEIAEYAERQKEKELKAQVATGSTNPRWNEVIKNIYSENVNDWKLAIIESDSMLDELLDQLGFKGETLGDKLKAADRNKFRHLTAAWEAHTVRNRIAHEGSNFLISSKEAKRIVAIYEQIFREYGFI